MFGYPAFDGSANSGEHSRFFQRRADGVVHRDRYDRGGDGIDSGRSDVRQQRQLCHRSAEDDQLVAVAKQRIEHHVETETADRGGERPFESGSGIFAGGQSAESVRDASGDKTDAKLQYKCFGCGQDVYGIEQISDRHADSAACAAQGTAKEQGAEHAHCVSQMDARGALRAWDHDLDLQECEDHIGQCGDQTCEGDFLACRIFPVHNSSSS